MGGTTSVSGWAVFWFLLGFTILATAAISGGIVSLIAGVAILILSVIKFKEAKEKEGV